MNIELKDENNENKRDAFNRVIRETRATAGSGTQKAKRDGVLPNATEEVKSNYRGVNVTTEIKKNPVYD